MSLELTPGGGWLTIVVGLDGLAPAGGELALILECRRDAADAPVTLFLDELTVE